MPEKSISNKFCFSILICTVFLALAAPSTFAQELEPRSYANTPVGINLMGAVLGIANGNVLLDPSLPIEDLDGDTQIGILRYVRSFGLLDRSAKLKLMVPYTSGDWEGLLDEEFDTRSASGFGDVRAEISWNIFGAPALTSEQIKNYQQKTIIGSSLRIFIPTGEYDSSKLINLGSNRWSFRAEIGVSRAFGKWAAELITSVWVFGDNDNFFGGQHLSQDELYAIKTHLVYTFRPGFWLGAGAGYGNGGRTAVDGIPRDNRQENLRVGIHLAYPFNKRHGVNVGWVTATNHGAGSEFDSITIGYQYAWGKL